MQTGARRPSVQFSSHSTFSPLESDRGPDGGAPKAKGARGGKEETGGGRGGEEGGPGEGEAAETVRAGNTEEETEGLQQQEPTEHFLKNIFIFVHEVFFFKHFG